MEGGCLCGAVRYRVTEPAQRSFLCHCKDCQRQSGSGYLPLMVVPRSGFAVEGETASFTTTGESGRKLVRHFCTTCGSPLYEDAEAMPDAVMITAGTLDDINDFTPARSIFANNRAHWDVLIEAPKTG